MLLIAEVLHKNGGSWRNAADIYVGYYIAIRAVTFVRAVLVSIFDVTD